MIYKPTVEYFKTLLPVFSYSKENPPTPLGIVSESFLSEQIEGVAMEVQARLREAGYIEPTEENSLPYINLKNYICLKVAETLRYQYAGDGIVLQSIKEKMERLEKEYQKDLKKITSVIQNSDSFPLNGKNIKQ